MISSSEILLQLRQQREAKKKRENDQYNLLRQQNMEPVQRLRASNSEALKQVESPGEGLLVGLLSGLGEGLVTHLAEMQFADQYLDWVRQATDQTAMMQQRNNQVQDWFAKNAEVIGDLTSKIKDLRPEQAKAMLTPLYEQLQKDMGFNIGELVDVNTANGNVTFRGEKGSLMQYSLFDLFPQIKQEMMNRQANQALQESQKDLLSDEAIIKASQKEYEDAMNMQREQQNEIRRHHQTVEGFERERLNMAKQASAEASAPPSEEQDFRAMYQEHIKNSAKMGSEKQKEITTTQNLIQDSQKALSIMQKLDALHKEAMTIKAPGITNPTMLGDMIRSGVKMTNLSKMDAEKLQRIDMEMQQITSALYSKALREDVIGTGASSNMDQKQLNETVRVLFWTTPANWQKYLKTRVGLITDKLKRNTQLLAKQQQEYKDIYQDYETFKKVRRGK